MSDPRLTIMYRPCLPKDRVRELIGSDDASIVCWDDVFAERDQLRAEVERLTAAAEDEAVYGDHNLVPSLQAEVEALRKDAERYRWLRDGCDSRGSRASFIAANCYSPEWDESIDAAMAEKEGGAQ